jgi:hypothetical protein
LNPTKPWETNRLISGKNAAGPNVSEASYLQAKNIVVIEFIRQATINQDFAALQLKIHSTVFQMGAINICPICNLIIKIIKGRSYSKRLQRSKLDPDSSETKTLNIPIIVHHCRSFLLYPQHLDSVPMSHY